MRAGVGWEGCDRQPEQQVTQIFSSTQLHTAAHSSLPIVQTNVLLRLAFAATAPASSSLQFTPSHHFTINRAENLSHSLLDEAAYAYEKLSEGADWTPVMDGWSGLCTSSLVLPAVQGRLHSCLIDARKNNPLRCDRSFLEKIVPTWGTLGAEMLLG